MRYDELGTPDGTEETLRDWVRQRVQWSNENPNQKGMKFSEGKPKWQLMKDLWPYIEEVVTVLTRGAEKYEPDNWKHVSIEGGEYIRAIMSHYTAYVGGEKIDPDMGTHHLANLICSCLFLMWHDDHRTNPIEMEELM